MTKKDLHDFLLEEVESFLADTTSQISTGSESISKEQLLARINVALRCEDFRMFLLSQMLKALNEVKFDMNELQKDIDETVALPRFNNDTILLFLQKLSNDVKGKFHSVPGLLFTQVLNDVIRKMMIVPASVISDLPNELNTPEALELLEKGRKADLLDENYKPNVELPDYVAALIADKIGGIIGLSHNRKWAPFRKYWGMDNLRQRFEEAPRYTDYPDYCKKIDSVFC